MCFMLNDLSQGCQPYLYLLMARYISGTDGGTPRARHALLRVLLDQQIQEIVEGNDQHIRIWHHTRGLWLRYCGGGCGKVV